jgi:hypothetical protein
VLGAALVYVATRLALLLAFDAKSSDTQLYAEYAVEQQVAATQHQSFYAFHRAQYQEAAKEAARTGGTPLAPEGGQIEYPPLAVQVLYWPQALFGQAPGSEAPSAALRTYAQAFRGEMALFDLLGLGALIASIGLAFPGESGGASAERVFFCAVAGLALPHLLYDRLDMVVAALLVLALALLLSRAHYAWSFAVLASAINFKLVPLVLVPVFAVGALPVSSVATSDGSLGRRLGALLAPLTKRLALLAGMTLACFLPFLAWSGREGLAFVRFHAQRGLQIESVLASALVLLRPLGLSFQVGLEAWGYDLHSPAADRLAKASPLLAIVLLGVTSFLLLSAVLRLRADDGGERAARSGAVGERLAQARPGTFLLFAVAFLMIAMAASKVFSPQYLIWLVPLLPLLPLRRRRRHLVWFAFLVACGVSTVLFPYLYFGDLVGEQVPAGGGPAVLHGPTPLGAALVISRNVLFVGLAAALCAAAARSIPGEEVAATAEGTGG